MPRLLRDYDTHAATNYTLFTPDVINQGQFVDVNGDGLVDVVYAYVHHRGASSSDHYDGDPEIEIKETYLNTGSGWENTADPSYEPPDYIYSYVDTALRKLVST